VTARPWGIVLDADVLLRSSVRDLFLYLASLDVVDPVWSEQILEEVARNFPTGRERFRSLRAVMETAFPSALKTGFEHHVMALMKTNQKDRHVLALAAEYEADLISFNHGHYDDEEASRYGVTVWAPDDALEELIQQNGADVQHSVERAYLMLRKPPVRWADYIEHVRADGMPKAAAWMESLPELRHPTA
jgi:hypothetical protein